jgi:hypothetical protein
MYNAEEMHRNARDVNKVRYELVRRITPKERLLEYKMDANSWAMKNHKPLSRTSVIVGRRMR